LKVLLGYWERQHHLLQLLLKRPALEKTDRRGVRRRGLGMNERCDEELQNCVMVLLSLVESAHGVIQLEKTF
jgi:hypothetical protein